MATLEIDNQRRELRVGERVCCPQPKVFDLLVYLAGNRQRIVPKGELLGAVWPGVVVTEAAIQRAVSLARAALAELGARDRIRTHSRHGYRFCAAAPPAAIATAELAVPVQRARLAYAEARWPDVLACFEDACDVSRLSAADLSCWSHAALCLDRLGTLLAVLESAVAEAMLRGQPRAAAWAAILVAQVLVDRSDDAPANGWLQRASRLLEAEGSCREQGYVHMLRARLALGENDPERALEHAEQAADAGRRFADPDLEGLGLMLQGQAALFSGKTREGLDALDEAAVAVRASGLSAWAGGLIYCGLIYCYKTRADWQRAAQWTEQFAGWCNVRGPAAYPVLCRMHRAEVLNVQGRLDEALAEAEAALTGIERFLPWARLRAWALIGEVQLSRGALLEARAAYVRAAELGWDSSHGLALVRFREGDLHGALRQLSQSVHQQGFAYRSQRGLMLAHLAIVASAAGQLEQARMALASLSEDPDLVETPGLDALAQQARGELLAAEGDRSAAAGQLRLAARMFRERRMPVACAEAHRALAGVLAADADEEGARLELAAAMQLFREAGAGGQLGACEALARSLDAAARAG